MKTNCNAHQSREATGILPQDYKIVKTLVFITLYALPISGLHCRYPSLNKETAEL
jgi:hypothetical protein